MKILSGTEILEDADMLHEGLKDDHCLLTSVVLAMPVGLFQMTCPGSCRDPTFRSICSDYSTTIMGLKLRANGSFLLWLTEILPVNRHLPKAEEARYEDGFAWDLELRGTADLSAWPNFTLSIASVKRKGTFCYENPEFLQARMEDNDGIAESLKVHMPFAAIAYSGLGELGYTYQWVTLTKTNDPSPPDAKVQGDKMVC